MRNKDIASDKLIYFLLVLKVIVKVNFEKLFCSLNVEPVEFQAILALIELIATHDYPRSEAEEKQSEFFNQSDYKIIQSVQQLTRQLVTTSKSSSLVEELSYSDFTSYSAAIAVKLLVVSIESRHQSD